MNNNILKQKIKDKLYWIESQAYNHNANSIVGNILSRDYDLLQDILIYIEQDKTEFLNCNEIEQVIIGACLVETNVFSDCFLLLNDSKFFNGKNKIIYESMLRLNNKKEKIDLLTVIIDLRKNRLIKEVGEAYIAELSSKVSSAAHLVYHCNILRQSYVQKEILKISMNVQENILTEDILELFEIVENGMSNLRNEFNQWS